MPEPTAQDLEIAQSLLGLFDQQADDGSYLFSDADVRHFLPLMLLELGDAVSPQELSPETQELLGQLAVAAGVDQDTPADEVSGKIAAFYERNPPHPTLLGAFQGFLREHVSGKDGGAGVTKAVKQLLGQEGASRPLDSGQPRAAGTVGGGLLARLGAQRALDEQKPGDDEG